MAEYRCNDCGFRVPADPTGIAIMQQHLKEHGSTGRSRLDNEPDPEEMT